VIFGGTFTAAGAEVSWPGGVTRIDREGAKGKFVDAVEQITFSGPFARERGQRVLYVTERAVFRLAGDGVELIEIAPGVDLQRDIIGRMGFTPKVSPDLKLMDVRIFLPGKMGLKSVLKSKPAKPRSARLERLDESSEAAE
jgi:propionate CoA-transferase